MVILWQKYLAKTNLYSNVCKRKQETIITIELAATAIRQQNYE